MKIKIISLVILFCLSIWHAPTYASEAAILTATNLKRLSKAIKQNKDFLAEHSVQFQNLPVSSNQDALYALYFYSGNPKSNYLSSTFLQYFEDKTYHYVFEEFSGKKCIKKQVIKRMTEKEANEIIEKRYFSGANRDRKIQLLSLVNSVKLD